MSDQADEEYAGAVRAGDPDSEKAAAAAAARVTTSGGDLCSRGDPIL